MGEDGGCKCWTFAIVLRMLEIAQEYLCGMLDFLECRLQADSRRGGEIHGAVPGDAFPYC